MIYRLIILLASLLGSFDGFSEKKTYDRTQLNPSRVLSDAQWTEDLDSLYTLLKRHHQNLYKRTHVSEFEQLYHEIKNNIPSLHDHEITAQFARFIALAHDGHTRLTLPLKAGIGLSQAHSKTELPDDTTLVFRHLPVEFYWFEEGLYVLKATKAYVHLIGHKVNMFNDVNTSDALEMARSLSHFDNEYGHKLIAPSRLSILEILQSLHIVKPGQDDVTLSVEKDGYIQKVAIRALDRFPTVDFFYFRPEKIMGPPVLTGFQNDVNYWYRYLEDEKTIYLQINQMNNASEGLGLIRFLAEVDRRIKGHVVDRIVLDLRNNFGGDNAYSVSIVNLLLKNPHLNQVGRFYTLIGRKTFSAAQHLVNDLRRWTDVIFVGEPTGSSPSSFGDAVKRQLPNSKLTVRIATIYWTDTSGRDSDVKWVAPDISVPTKAFDYFQNMDAAFQQCLDYPASLSLVDIYVELYKSGGMPTARRLYIRLASDWDTPGEDFKALEAKLVEWLEANR